MRRFLLIFTVLSVPGWSQSSAQQPAQPPIVVKVEMPPPPPRDFLGNLQALGPLIAAFVAVIVGLTQWYLQKKYLEQNSFERRYAVYEALKKYMGAIYFNHGKDDDFVNYKDFLSGTRGSQFLFNPDVVAYIAEIRTLGVDTFKMNQVVVTCVNELKADNTKANFDRLVAAQNALSSTILLLEKRLSSTEVEGVFAEYLQLDPRPKWPCRLKARIDRWMESEVPAKFASKAKD
jgi:hypothetical protein